MAPELYPPQSVQVVKTQPEDNRGDQLLRWAQKRALETLDTANLQAEQIRQEARQEGYAEGRQEAQQEVRLEAEAQRESEQRAWEEKQRILQNAFDQSVETLECLHREQTAALQNQFQGALVELALEIGTTLALRSLSEHGAPLEALIEKALTALGEPLEVTVRIGNRTHLDSLRETAGSRYQLKFDDSLEEWDVRVESEAGDANSFYQARLQAVRDALFHELG